MYYCARAFGLSKLASSFAGVFYMFAPYLVSMVQPGHDGKMYVTALFPLTMLFLERGMNNGKLLDFTLLGAAIGLLILTPHPQMSYFALWAIGFYFGFRIVLLSKKRLCCLRGILVCWNASDIDKFLVFDCWNCKFKD